MYIVQAAQLRGLSDNVYYCRTYCRGYKKNVVETLVASANFYSTQSKSKARRRLGGKTLGQSFTAESKKIKTVRKIENFRRYPPLVRLKQLLTNSNNANSHDTVNMILLVTRVIPD